MRPRFSLAIVVAAMMAWPATTRGQEPRLDSVTWVPGRADSFVFSAWSGPLGENPTGHARLGFVPSPRGGGYSGEKVTCLSVRGNQAVAIVVGKHWSPGGGPIFDVSRPFTAVVRVSDLSSGRGSQDRYDWREVSPGSEDCFSVPSLTGGSLTQTDIEVRDAQPPPPLTKQQCRLGGYLDSGFRTLDACVWSVELQCADGHYAVYGFKDGAQCLAAINRVTVRDAKNLAKAKLEERLGKRWRNGTRRKLACAARTATTYICKASWRYKRRKRRSTVTVTISADTVTVRIR